MSKLNLNAILVAVLAVQSLVFGAMVQHYWATPDSPLDQTHNRVLGELLTEVRTLRQQMTHQVERNVVAPLDESTEISAIGQALRAALREQFREYMGELPSYASAGAPVHGNELAAGMSPPELTLLDPDVSGENRVVALAMIDNAVAQGSWGQPDRERMMQVMQQMNDEDRVAVLDQFAQMVNSQQLSVADPAMLIF